MQAVVDFFKNTNIFYAAYIRLCVDRYEYYEDTHVWFMSENGAEEVKYNMPNPEPQSKNVDIWKTWYEAWKKINQDEEIPISYVLDR